MGFYRRFRKPDGQTTSNNSASEKEKMMSEPKAPNAAQQPQSAPTQPGATPQVKEVSAEELKARLDSGNAPLLIDVREPWEHQIVNIEGAKLIPMNTIPEQMNELDKNAEIVVHCHHGQRSWNVANYLLQHGFTNVKNLTGGIDSWARRVDKTKRTY